MSIKCHSQQTDKAGEWQHARNFQYPQTKTMLLEMGLDALDYGIALCACQRSRKISHPSASAFIAAQGARSLSRQPRKRTRDPVRSAMSVGKWDSVGTLQTVEYADVHHGLQQGQGTTGNDFDHAQQRQMHFLMQAAAGEC